MRVLGSRLGKSRHLLLSVLVVLTFSIASFGNKPNRTGGGSPNISLTISSVGPSAGPTSGGTTVTLIGAGFTHSASVAFGGAVSPTVTYVSSTELQATTPAHASGTVTVAVTENPHNRSATLTGGFTFGDSLSVSGISPSQGSTSGGTVVTVKGTGFQTGATVAFGRVQSNTVTVTSSGQIDVMSPPESSGTVAITVTDPNSQSASLPSAFTYTSGTSVTSISPNSGPVIGGTTTTILGRGFQSGSNVSFGGVAAASVTFVSSTEIQAVTPGSKAGTVSVAVTSGSQSSTLASAFTFFHTVSLSWAANSSTVSGYNVYRSSISGGPYSKLNSTLIAGTSFIDSNVQAGSTYFYVATAVNSSGVESAYSSQAEAVVPSP